MMKDFQKVIDGELCDVQPQSHYDTLSQTRDYYTAVDVDDNVVYSCEVHAAMGGEYLGLFWFDEKQNQVTL